MKNYDEDRFATPDRPRGERHLPSTMVGSRQITDYDPGVAMAVCERLMEGGKLMEILDEPGMPTRATWYRWMLIYGDLHKAFERALKVSAFHMEEKMLQKADQLMDGNAVKSTMELDQLKQALTQLRWSAARRDPGRYGERATQNVVVPIQINTSLDLSGGVASKPQSMYHIEAIRPVEADPEREEEGDAEDADFSDMERSPAFNKPQPTPPRHKTPGQIAKTKAAYARRERTKQEKKRAGTRTRAGG